MEQAEPWTERQHAAMRAILLLWHELSRGDIDIICRCVPEPSATVLTVRGAPHARFWQELVEIGWAEQLYSPIDPHGYDREPLAFRLEPGAERPLSHFLVFYDLLNMGACTPAPDAEALRANYQDLNASRAKGVERVRGTRATFGNARFAVRAWGFLAILLVGIAIGGVIAG